MHKELVNLKKVLGDEKRRSNSDSNKLTELQALFANSMKSYNEAVEHAKQLGTSPSHVFTNPEFYVYLFRSAHKTTNLMNPEFKFP